MEWSSSTSLLLGGPRVSPDGCELGSPPVAFGRWGLS
jgi:hypothetical protein